MTAFLPRFGRSFFVASVPCLVAIAFSSATANADSRRHREPPPPPPASFRPRVATFTLDVPEFAATDHHIFHVVSELRVGKSWGFAQGIGYGERALETPTNPTVRAWQYVVEPRWYALGDFENGVYVSWATAFARALGGPVGYTSLAPPPGLSSGFFLGFKSTDVPIITPDVGIGLLVPIVVPSAEVSHPAVALVVRFGVGFPL